MTRKISVSAYIMIFAATLALLSINSAYCTTVPVSANQDTYVTIYEPDNNFGLQTDILIEAYVDHQARSLVQFDLSSIPSEATVSSATLKLYHAVRSAAEPAGRVIWAYRLTQSWTETGATWNSYDGINPWTTLGGDYTATDGAAYTMTNTLPRWIEWDVTNIAKAWIESGQPNYGFLIKDADETPTDNDYWSKFRSREYTNQPDRNPILEISYTVPTPTPTPTRPPYVGGTFITLNTNQLPTIILIAALIAGIATTYLAVKTLKKQKTNY